jgi:cytochrome c553
MKNIFKQAVIAVGFIAVAQGALAAGDAAAGAEKVAVCAACHGSDGNSPAPTFPKIAGLGEKYLLKQLKDIKSGQRPVLEMTGMLDGLNDQDLADVAAFFNSKPMQLSGSLPQSVRVNAGIEVDGLELGERIFRSGNPVVGAPACSGCHSPRGLGNDPAGYPRLSGQYAEYIEKQLRAFRAGERVNDGDQRTMRQVTEYLTDSEIKAVANYISGLN